MGSSRSCRGINRSNWSICIYFLSGSPSKSAKRNYTGSVWLLPKPEVVRQVFKTAQDAKFCELLSRDWANTELGGPERWQAGMYINTLFVDIFDTYDKIEIGMADTIELEMRMNLLKSGNMKLDQAKMIWNLWKPTRPSQFIQWFESEVFDGEDITEFNLSESPHSTGVIR